MNFACLVSTSPTRRPLPMAVEATDAAAAAHAAAVTLGFPSARAWVHARHQGRSWIVTDGFTTHRVQILSEEA